MTPAAFTFSNEPSPEAAQTTLLAVNTAVITEISTTCNSFLVFFAIAIASSLLCLL
jgi:hypothetical protein